MTDLVRSAEELAAAHGGRVVKTLHTLPQRSHSTEVTIYMDSSPPTAEELMEKERRKISQEEYRLWHDTERAYAAILNAAFTHANEAYELYLKNGQESLSYRKKGEVVLPADEDEVARAVAEQNRREEKKDSIARAKAILIWQNESKRIAEQEERQDLDPDFWEMIDERAKLQYQEETAGNSKETSIPTFSTQDAAYIASFLERHQQLLANNDIAPFSALVAERLYEYLPMRDLSGPIEPTEVSRLEALNRALALLTTDEPTYQLIYAQIDTDTTLLLDHLRQEGTAKLKLLITQASEEKAEYYRSHSGNIGPKNPAN